MGMCLGTFPCCLVTKNYRLVSDSVILCGKSSVVLRVKKS